MRRNIFDFGAWQFLGNFIENELESGPDVPSSSVFAIMVVAICPRALAASVKNPKAKELAVRFSECYEKWPDLTLKLETLIRKKWNPRNYTENVRKYFLTNVWHVPKEESSRTRGGRIELKVGKRIVMADAKTEKIQHNVDEIMEALNSSGRLYKKLDKNARLAAMRDADSKYELVKKILNDPRRLKLPKQQLLITSALNAAAQELRSAGFDIGWGS